jgi:TonB family protein
MRSGGRSISRVALAFALSCGFFATTVDRARALTEICPAQVEVAAVSSAAHKDMGPATIFGFALTSAGPRSVSGRLAFDTSAGWFTVDVPSVALTEKNRHYNAMLGHWSIPSWVSPVMYVQFPTSVTLNHSWLYSASAKDDGDFGWEKSGTFICPPPPGPQAVFGNKTISIAISRLLGATHHFERPSIDLRDVDALAATPPPGATKFAAKYSTPLETAACAKPFADAVITMSIAPDYPAILQSSRASRMVGIGVAINADGKLADSWIWAPSGLEAFDQSALSAAQSQSYSGAVSYCRPVPALYSAWFMFDSP